jgi:hypothetical protein
MSIRRLRIAVCVTKATNIRSEYAIRILFPLQQWLHERASLLRYAYIAWVVNFCYILIAHISCKE